MISCCIPPEELKNSNVFLTTSGPCECLLKKILPLVWTYNRFAKKLLLTSFLVFTRFSWLRCRRRFFLCNGVASSNLKEKCLKINVCCGSEVIMCS